MSSTDRWIAAVGAVSSLGAAGFWLWASLLPVPNNQDTFIEALQLSSRINAIAAICASAAAICAAYSFLKSFFG
jgi:hypothetical protein